MRTQDRTWDRLLVFAMILASWIGCNESVEKNSHQEIGERRVSETFLEPPLPPLPPLPENTLCTVKDALRVLPGEDLQEIINNAPSHSIIHISYAKYGEIRIPKPLTLIGWSAEERCSPSGGSDGPLFTRIQIASEAKETHLQGLRVERGGVHVEAPSTLKDIHSEKAETSFVLNAPTTLVGFIAKGSSIGVAIHAKSRIQNGLVIHNQKVGVQSFSASTLSYLTVSSNKGNGVELLSPGNLFFNSILSENKGWGLFEGAAASLLEHLSFAKNQKGHFGGNEENTFEPAIEWEQKRFIAITLKQGDRRGTEPALATRAIIRAQLSKTVPWKKSQEKGALLEQYIPHHGIQSARRGYSDPTQDLAGNPRPLNPSVGALEPLRSEVRPRKQWYVNPTADPDGNGELATPLRFIQKAVDQALPGDVINLFPGLYKESVLIQETHLTLRGITLKEGALVPIESLSEELPVIDPSGTGTHEQALFLQDTLYGMRLEGFAIAQAMTGLTVIGRIDDIPPEPVIRFVLFKDNAKGMDADCGGGILSNCLFENNQIATTFRAGNHWIIRDNVFKGPGNAMVFSMLITHGIQGFQVLSNLFDGANVYADSLHGRHDSTLLFAKNTFKNASLVVRHGSPKAHLSLQENIFQDGGNLVLEEPSSTRATCSGCSQVDKCIGHCNPKDEKETPWPQFEDKSERPLPHSSPIAITQDGDILIAVGADFEGVAILDTRASDPPQFVKTGKDPRGVAIRKDAKEALVVNFGAGTLSAIHLESLQVQWQLPLGLEPFGVVYSPNEKEAWVTLSGENKLAIVDLDSRSIVRKIPLDRKPRGISLDFRNGKWRALVTHFSPRHLPGKRVGTLESIEARLSFVEDLDDSTWTVRTLSLPPVESEHFPAALPVLMQSVVVRGSRAYLPSFGATPERPNHVYKNGRALLPFETTVQALLTVVDLDRERVLTKESANLNAPGRILNGPYGLAFAPGNPSEVILPIYGNNSIARFKLAPGHPPEPLRAYRGSVDIFVGTNPRGVVTHPNGKTAYTVNFASGNLTVVDLKRSQPMAMFPLGPKARDRLSSLARQGKELFYTTQRVDTVADFWFTCGTCHPDGRTDGITWEFSIGPRSTPVIAASLDTLPLHFDGDRDELSDFEHTVRELQGGFSLARKKLIPALPEPMGEPEHGWKAIEAYLREGIDSPAAPKISPQEEKKGSILYLELGCDTCHGGPWFGPEPLEKPIQVANNQITNTLKDVGTRTERDVFGRKGFDPPSLWGIHQTAPYLHDGSAESLRNVLSNRKHLYAGLAANRAEKTLTDEEWGLLEAYLRTISEGTLMP